MTKYDKKNTVQAPFYFMKDYESAYFELLRLARVFDERRDTNRSDRLITTLNQISKYANIHKRLIPLLNDKAHKLKVFNRLTDESKKILTNGTQQGIVTELARKKQLIYECLLSSHDHQSPTSLCCGVPPVSCLLVVWDWLC
jgi:hypothetical protein